MTNQLYKNHYGHQCIVMPVEIVNEFQDKEKNDGRKKKPE